MPVFFLYWQQILFALINIIILFDIETIPFTHYAFEDYKQTKLLLIDIGKSALLRETSKVRKQY